MKLNDLAKKVGKSAPYVLVLQKKFGLPACTDYPEGYAVLVKKRFATLLFTWPVRFACKASKGKAVEIYREPFATSQTNWNCHAFG